MKLLFLVFTLSMPAFQAWGHGEDKPGPNGGFIRMPGAYHTEILPIGTNKLAVFLLDINWKNPSVKNSALSVTFQSKNKVEAVCEIKDSRQYLCSFPKNVDITKAGKLVVTSQREGQKGMQVSYDLPLKFQSIGDSHEGHH